MGRAQRRKQENRRRRLEEAREAASRRVRRRKLIAGWAALGVGVLGVASFFIFSGGSVDVEADPPDVEETSATTTGLEEDPPVSDVPIAEDEQQMESTSTSITDERSSEPDSPALAEGCPAPDGSDGPKLDFDGPQPMCIDPAKNYMAVFDTSEGEIRFELTPDVTPGTVNNFVTLARWGYYDGTLLFRTDPSIDIIQGGSPHTNSPSDPGPGYTIPDEPPFSTDPDTGQPVGPYRYQPGQLVMARSAGFDSAGAQFFITTGPNAARLDGQGVYVVFGTTDEAGLEVARSIMDLHVPGGQLGGAPSREVVVHSVTIEETPS